MLQECKLHVHGMACYNQSINQNLLSTLKQRQPLGTPEQNQKILVCLYIWHVTNNQSIIHSKDRACYILHDVYILPNIAYITYHILHILHITYTTYSILHIHITDCALHISHAHYILHMHITRHITYTDGSSISHCISHKVYVI